MSAGHVLPDCIVFISNNGCGYHIKHCAVLTCYCMCYIFISGFCDTGVLAATCTSLLVDQLLTYVNITFTFRDT